MGSEMQLHLSALPSAEQYEQSLMHRDVVNFVLVTATGFIVTTSIGGHIKFWKKIDKGTKFVKHLKAHLGAIVAIDADHYGELLATGSVDQELKIFDVVSSDMINAIKLDFFPNALCWASQRDSHVSLLACSDKNSPTIYIFDGKGEKSALLKVFMHHSPVHIMSYNPTCNVIVSVDQQGCVEYWHPNSSEATYASKPAISWEYKSDTDLYVFQKEKGVPSSLQFSSNYKMFCTFGFSDCKIRIFNFYTGRLMKCYSEDLSVASENRQLHKLCVQDDMEFGRRLALEREILSAKQGQPLTANAVFDYSGNFIIYATIYGIKIVNIRTNKVVRILGKFDNQRFMRIALYQDSPEKKGFISIAMAASDNPAFKKSEMLDPTIFATAYKKNRFYMFTQREPNFASGISRDIFNEKPTREEQTVAAQENAPSALCRSAVIHTSLGDICVQLFPDYVPKTVENFVGLIKKNYYDNVIFHRVIKGFIIQTGDPNGDGTGGESIFGSNFQDEFHTALNHNRPYMLSMANIGANTNGSQFFITTVPAPWLNNKHTVFGIVTSGTDVVHKIENLKTDKLERPIEEVRIIGIEVRS